MVDRADPVFFGADWRFADYCQQPNAGSVYLQSVLKYRRAALRFRAQAGQVTAKGTICRFAIDLSRFASSKVPTPIFFLSKQDLTAVARTYNRFAGRFHASPSEPIIQVKAAPILKPSPSHQPIFPAPASPQPPTQSSTP